MDSDYLIYNFVNIEDSPKPKNIFLKNKDYCLNICGSNTDCQGVNIAKPKCENSNILDECVKSNMNNGISNITPKNLTEYNCTFLTNINNTNYVTNSENNNSFIKKQYGNNLNNISLNQKYYLKINDKYIGIDSKSNFIFLVNFNEISSASIFQFNNNGNIIETKSNKCIEINGDYLVLKDCIQDNISQEFIYENKSNTIRPLNDNFVKNLCFSLDKKNTSNNIVLEECDYLNNTSQSIQTKIETELETNINTTYSKENFKSDKDNFNDLKKINFCSNAIYKTIVTLILCCILIYLIWYLTRKQYKDIGESDIFVKSSIIN